MRSAKEIKDEIAQRVKEYYELMHQEKRFEAGKSKINYAGRCFDSEDMVSAMDSVLDFWLTHGRYSKKFEKELAQALGVKYSLLVNSGSSANLLAFMALTSPLLKERQIKRGDEVITVAACFPTTIAPMVQYGAVPVFVDVDPHTLNIDVFEMEKGLSSRTRAVMLAHSLGNPFPIHEVKAFCDKHNLWLIEDNCDALGSVYDGKWTGSWGDIGTSSFYPPHHITMGEGGAVYTSNDLLQKIMLSLRDWGRDCWCESGKDNTCGKRFEYQLGSLPYGYDHKYTYSHFGYNLKATDMQAAIGLTQLQKLSGFTQLRKKNTEIYRELLSDLGGFFEFVYPLPESDPSWFGFHLLIKDPALLPRHELVGYLEAHKVQTRSLFSGNVTRHPCFESLVEGQDFRIVGDLNYTDKIMNDGFWLGVYPGMTRDRIEYTCLQIRAFLNLKNLSHSS